MTRGAETRVAADALVLATCTVAETTLQDELAQDELAESDLEVHAIGDCPAPRQQRVPRGAQTGTRTIGQGGTNP